MIPALSCPALELTGGEGGTLLQSAVGSAVSGEQGQLGLLVRGSGGPCGPVTWRLIQQEPGSKGLDAQGPGV